MVFAIDCQDSTQPWCLPNGWDRPRSVFTSPRYNKGMDYGRDSDGVVIKDDTDPAHYYFHLTDAWRRCHAETTPDATLWVNTKSEDPAWDSFVHCSLTSSGWVLQKTFAWVFHVALPDGRSIGQFSASPRAANPHSGFELVRLYRKEGQPVIKLCRDAEGVGVPYSDKTNLSRFTAGTGGEVKEDRRCRGDVWLIPYDTRQRRDHPCPFPVGLPEMAFRLLGLPQGSVVVDPFCGSGSTGVAAVRLGLSFYGIDLNPQYCEAARKRLEVLQPREDVDRFARALASLKQGR